MNIETDNRLGQIYKDLKKKKGKKYTKCIPFISEQVLKVSLTSDDHLNFPRISKHWFGNSFFPPKISCTNSMSCFVNKNNFFFTTNSQGYIKYRKIILIPKIFLLFHLNKGTKNFDDNIIYIFRMFGNFFSAVILRY